MADDKSLYLTVTWQGDTESYQYKSYGPGFRKDYIIHYVKKGSGYFHCNGKIYRVCEGESFIIYPDIVVQYYPDQNDPWDYAWVNFDGIQAEKLLKHISFSLDSPVLPAMTQNPYELFKKICITAYDTNLIKSAKSSRLCGYLHLLLSYYMEHYPVAEVQYTEECIAECATAYISENICRKELSVEKTAKHLGISRATLYRAFESDLNISPAAYINKQRINEACSKITESTFSIKTIAYSLGFDDPSYFSKVFKRYTGFSPAEYRQITKK